MSWTTDDLLTSLKLRGVIPNSTALLTNANLLVLANEELELGIMALIKSVSEDYGLLTSDIAFVSGQLSYSIPTRAGGMALRGVQRVTAAGQVIASYPRITLEQLDYETPSGIYLKGNQLWLVQDPGVTTDLLRVTYQCRPGVLTSTTGGSVGQITAINTGTKTVTFSSIPANFTSSLTYDLIQQNPGFDYLAIDQTASVSGSTLVFTNTLPTNPALAVGDWVGIAGLSPIPQVPPELHPVLAQKTYIRAMQALGDKSAMQLGEQALGTMERNAMLLLTPRVTGTAQKIVARVNTLTALRPQRRLRRDI